jgi:hypothetical protein
MTMKSGRYGHAVCRLVLCVMGFLGLRVQVACLAAVPQGIVKDYRVQIELFSMQPDRVLDSHEWHGSGTASPNSTVGLGCRDESRDFTARIQPRLKDDHLFADVTVAPSQSDKMTQAQVLEVDLSAMEPKAVKLARNEDGRVYMLSLTPSIKTVDVTPKRADEAALEFNKWVLQRSPVIVNDRLYAGRMDVSGGYKAYVDIGGVGKFEFAMQPFRDAKLLGTLQDGRIHIECDDGTTIEIDDVKNGVHGMRLPGGPYAVWVRQSPSTQVEKYAIPPEQPWSQQVKADLARMGRTPPSDEELHLKYEQLKSQGPPVTMITGVGPISQADRVE